MNFKEKEEEISVAEGICFQKDRPNDPILFYEESEEEDSDDGHKEIIEIKSPTFWNQFALIGSIETRLADIVDKYKISIKTGVKKLNDCLEYLLNQKYGKIFLNRNFEMIMENLPCKIIFVSVIPRFTPREYGKGKTFYFIHIRFSWYIIAESRKQTCSVGFPNEYLNYGSVLGNKHTHVPISEEKDILINNQNFDSLMKMLKGKQGYDLFQPEYDPKQDQRKSRIIKTDKKSYYHSEEFNPTYETHTCKLHLEDAHSGFAEIIEGDEKGKRIHLYNRRNCFQAFNEDIVDAMIFKKGYARNSLQEKDNFIPFSGRVTKILHSNVQPVNKVFLCHLIFGKSDMMEPICKTIPVIKVDNKYAMDQAKKHHNDLRKMENVVNSNSLIQTRVHINSAGYFANKYLVTIKHLNSALITTVKEIRCVDSYKCDFIFLVLYRWWNNEYQFPFGEVVGLYTPDVKLENTLNLIKVACDISTIGIDEEKVIQSEILKLKISKMKELNKLQKKNLNKKHKKRVQFCLQYPNKAFNEIAYSYEENEEGQMIIGVHIPNVSKFIPEDSNLDKCARDRFFTFLLPSIIKDERNHLQPDYLFSTSLTTEFLSIQKDKETSVISCYLTVTHEDIDPSIEYSNFIQEKFMLEMEIDALGTDQIINNDVDGYHFLNRIYEFCRKYRHKRIKDHIKPNCFYPNFELKVNETALVMEEELQFLINKKASMIYRDFRDIDSDLLNNFCIEAASNGDINLSSLLHSLISRFTPSLALRQHQNPRCSKQLLNEVIRRDSINLFKCESLLPNVGSYHQKWKKLWCTEIGDSYVLFHKKKSSITGIDFGNTLKIAVNRSNKNLVCSKLLSITNPLTCYLDAAMQRIIMSKNNDDEVKIQIKSHYKKYEKYKIYFDKFWQICKGYEIRHLFDGSSFVLDCVYEDHRNDRIFFHHPFLEEINHENFFFYKSLNLNDISTNKLGLTWKTKIFVFNNENTIENDNSYGNIVSLKDIFSFTLKHAFGNSEIEINPYINYPYSVNSDSDTEGNVYIDDDFDIYEESDIEEDSDIYGDFYTEGDYDTEEEPYIEVVSTMKGIKIEDLKGTLESNPYKKRITSEIIQNIDPIITLSHCVQPRQIMRIQFGYDYSNGIMKIIPELWIINPDFRVCLCHRSDPLKYFMNPQELLKINYKRFHNIEEYKTQFIILNRLEAIHQTIDSESSFYIHDLKVDWIAMKHSKDEIDYNLNDDNFGIVVLEANWCKERFLRFVHKRANVLDSFQALLEAVKRNKMDYLLCVQTFIEEKNVYWIGHCRVVDICLVKKDGSISNQGTIKKKDNLLVYLTMKLVHSSFPLKHSKEQLYSLEFMEIPISSRIFEKTLKKLQPDSLPARILTEDISLLFVSEGISRRFVTEYISGRFVTDDLSRRFVTDDLSRRFVKENNSTRIVTENNSTRMLRKYISTKNTDENFNVPPELNLNDKQKEAIKKSITSEFTLIWGPPGTGKTVVGCLIAYQYVIKNREKEKESAVLYCGPSNKSVDVVAEKLIQIFGENCPKLLRIFNSEIVHSKVFYPLRTSRSSSAECPETLKEIALHNIVKTLGKPYAKQLSYFEDKFHKDVLRSEMERSEFADKLIKYEYYQNKAFETEIKEGKYEIILTTAAGSCKKLLKTNGLEINQVILDECGMCSELEALGPMVNTKNLEKLVFIGDHKQLRPIITCPLAKGKQLHISLFERLYKAEKEYCVMLDTQYRMHPSICEFPSNYIYGNNQQKYRNQQMVQLKTARCERWTGIPEAKVDSNFNGLQYTSLYKNYKRDLLKNNINIADEFWLKGGQRKKNFECFPKDIDFNGPDVFEKILFINTLGLEKTQEISCSTGKNQSKSNPTEAKIVKILYERLIKNIHVKEQAAQAILVITQYRYQESILKETCEELLKRLRIPGPSRVSTVVKSQGSESDYVIFSTVRSLPHLEDIDTNPSPAWIGKYLGFITDENQVNVALTRAKKGLFIIGNSHLLSVNYLWKALIDDLKKRKCFVDENIF